MVYPFFLSPSVILSSSVFLLSVPHRYALTPYFGGSRELPRLYHACWYWLESTDRALLERSPLYEQGRRTRRSRLESPDHSLCGLDGFNRRNLVALGFAGSSDVYPDH